MSLRTFSRFSFLNLSHGSKPAFKLATGQLSSAAKKRNLTSTSAMNSNIKIMTMKDKSTEWRNVLTPWLDFFKYEPLNSAVEGFQSENGKQCLEGLLKDTLLFDDTPCVVAWDTDKDQAAGFIINQTFYKDPTPEQAKPPVPFANQNWDPECLPQIMEVEKTMQSLSQKYDVFTDLGVKKIFKTQVMCVSPKYMKHGVAQMMGEEGFKVALDAKYGYEAVVSECTSHYSYKASLKFGFRLAYECDFSECYSGYDKMANKSTHQRARVMVYKIK